MANSSVTESYLYLRNFSFAVLTRLVVVLGPLLVQEAKATILMENTIKDTRSEMMNASFKVPGSKRLTAYKYDCVKV